MKEQSGALNHAGLARLGHLVSTASANLLDFILPPRCASCGERTDRDVGLCATCWPNLSFITDPYCQHCGVPFEFSIPGTS
ncbi:MAG: double zinc ribbon domain-containing protein, partial [Pseudomonadota bacterium]